MRAAISQRHYRNGLHACSYLPQESLERVPSYSSRARKRIIQKCTLCFSLNFITEISVAQNLMIHTHTHARQLRPEDVFFVTEENRRKNLEVFERTNQTHSQEFSNTRHTVSIISSILLEADYLKPRAKLLKVCVLWGVFFCVCGGGGGGRRGGAEK